MNTAEMKDLSVQEKRALQAEESTHQGPHYEPAVDIFETSSALIVEADMPGVVPENLDINIRDNVLTLVGRVSAVEPRWKPLYDEYGIGHYSRQFRLGQQIDQTKIAAKMRDGVLTLELPKAESAKPRKINVETVS